MEQVVEISTEVAKDVAEQQITELSLEMLGNVGGGIIDVKV